MTALEQKTSETEGAGHLERLDPILDFGVLRMQGSYGGGRQLSLSSLVRGR
jgi:hypothetical protein